MSRGSAIADPLYLVFQFPPYHNCAAVNSSVACGAEGHGVVSVICTTPTKLRDVVYVKIVKINGVVTTVDLTLLWTRGISRLWLKHNSRTSRINPYTSRRSTGLHQGAYGIHPVAVAPMQTSRHSLRLSEPKNRWNRRERHDK